MKLPKSHPRFESLKTREKLVTGFKEGYVAINGLIAQGRGECFDYLLEEKTQNFAMNTERVAVALLLLSKSPVISVNGNVAALCGREICKLAKILKCPVEVNLFYWTKKRGEIIEKKLRKFYDNVLTEKTKKIPNLNSKRANVSRYFYNADVALIPLEDGDRAEALVKMKKNVIAIDLNPLSRTSQNATISIVDNIVRAIPNMITYAEELKNLRRDELEDIVKKFKNEKNLKMAINFLKGKI
ncbi:MAG: hypothetical protein BWK75_02475 [Candidatus Altiarchaeales archaeon A3]|nr:MAG: hypothetical protein BWK75_02475 [Candidatus Altiarchaeales archaeon A3]